MSSPTIEQQNELQSRYLVYRELLHSEVHDQDACSKFNIDVDIGDGSSNIRKRRIYRKILLPSAEKQQTPRA